MDILEFVVGVQWRGREEEVEENGFVDEMGRVLLWIGLFIFFEYYFNKFYHIIKYL